MRLRTLLVEIPGKIVSVAWKAYLLIALTVCSLALLAALISLVLGLFGLPPL